MKEFIDKTIEQSKMGLFWEIDAHLLRDEKPSDYLKVAYQKSLFREHPFMMLHRLREVEQSPQYHPEGNVWNHTLMVVDEAAKVKGKSRNHRVFMWAALLHDIGKASSTKIKKGKITSYNHDKAGAELAAEFLAPFIEEKRILSEICELIRYHMQILYVVKGLRFADIEGLKRSSDVREVALLGLCDRLGRANSNPEQERDNIRRFLQKCGSSPKEKSGGKQDMAKAGMKRPDPKQPHGTESNQKMHIPKNDAPPVPEIQGKAKNGNKKANPM